MKKTYPFLGLIWLVAAFVTGCLPGPGVEPPDNPGKTTGTPMDASTNSAPDTDWKTAGAGDTAAGMAGRGGTSGQTASGCPGECWGMDSAICAADAGATCDCTQGTRSTDGGACDGASFYGSCADSGEDCGVVNSQTTQ